MEALFDQSNRAHSNDKVKDLWDSDSYPEIPDLDSDSDSPFAPSYQEETSPQSPEFPLPPPPLEQPHRSIGASTSITWYEPPPEPSLPDVAEEDSVDTAVTTHAASCRVDQDSAGRSLRRTGDGSITTTNGSDDIPKKVAFLSPPPPLGLNADPPLPQDASTSNNSAVVRLQPSHPKDPRGSMSTAASGSRPDVGSSKNSTQTVKASVTSPYSAMPAYGDGVSIHQSLRSGTPFSQKSIGSVLLPASWSECVEEDLVTRLGPRERTRQEALGEIVASEERYGFCPCLLNKSATNPQICRRAAQDEGYIYSSPTPPKFNFICGIANHVRV